LKSLNPLECFEEYLLAYILGGFAVAEDANSKRRDRGAIGEQEELQRLLASAACHARERSLFGFTIDAFVSRLYRRRAVAPSGCAATRGAFFHIPECR
jgi:hypothetical protein